MGKIKGNARAVAIGLIYNNINVTQQKIARHLNITKSQVQNSMEKFREMLECQAMAVELNQLWVRIKKEVKLLDLQEMGKC